MFRLWLRPKVWLHGSQSTMTGGSAARNGHTGRITCWLAASIRWVLSTPLGTPVDPEVNKILATLSGSTAADAAARVAPGRVASRRLNGSAPSRRPALTITGTGGSPAGIPSAT